MVIPEKDVPFVRAQLIKTAKDMMKDKTCKQCHSTETKLKVIPLFETNPLIPSNIVAYCSHCHWSESVMWEKDDKARKFAQMLQDKINNEMANEKIKAEVNKINSKK